MASLKKSDTLTGKWKHLILMLPGEVNPVRNSSRYNSKPSGVLGPAVIILECNPATGGTAEQWGNISNGVNIISYCALARAHLAGQSGGKNQVKNEKRIYLF